MAAKRPMEDFFCNLTYSFEMEEHPRFSMSSETNSIGYRPTMPPNEIFSFKAGVKTPEPSGAIRHFTDEPMFWRGYASEEEVASPIDTDAMSFRTASSRSDESEPPGETNSSSFPEQLAQRRNRVEQQCSRAQAVTLVPAKAKVVSMPRLVDVSATPRMRRPAPITPIRPPVSRLNRMKIDSQTSSQESDSPRTSSEKSPGSPAPSSVAALLTRGKSVRQRPSLPNLQATARYTPSTPQSASSTHVPKAADFLRHDPYPSSPSDQPSTPPPMSPSRRRLHKISSSFGLNVFGMKRSNSSDRRLGETLETIKEPEPVTAAAPKALEPQTLARTPSSKPKMVARGANERAPLLVLPPCPESYEDERDVTQWPARKDPSIISMPTKLHKRQRSMSAALVSVQA